MDYTGFLQELHQEMIRSNGLGERHIIKFPNSHSFKRCTKLIKEQQAKFPLLTQIKTLKSIHAIICPLLSNAPLNWPGLKLQVEQDSVMHVHSACSLSAVKSTAASSSLPWGVRQIHAPQVWGKSMGSRIRIAIIDTGVDFQHPDLRATLSYGVNLINRSMLPHDDNGHGTHIAGIIGATNSGSGMLGVAPRASIHPVKAFDRNGTAFISDIVRGIDWAVQNGIHVINMSFGMKYRSSALLDAVRKAYQAGVIIVASSGNEGKRGTIDYPARFPQTIAVGAVNRERKIASFSNRGKFIDIYAPGDKIRSTWTRGKYHELSGTSMATSHVSGVIALLLSHYPNLKPTDIKNILVKSAIRLRSKREPGKGRIDATRVFRYTERGAHHDGNV